MSRPARIALIIPCYNDGDLVTEAVASVCEAEPIEICVADDGSSDAGSRAALATLEGAGVKIVWGDNRGSSAARMEALRATRAPFVFSLDADDLLVPGALGRLADLLATRPDASFAFGDYASFGDREGRWRTPEWGRWRLLWANWWGPSAMFRREALEAVGGWRLGGDYEDWDLWLTLGERGHRGVRLDEVVWKRRLHGERQQSAKRRQHARLVKHLQRRHPGLYQRRRALRREQGAPRWQELVYPLVLGTRPCMPYWLERRALAIWMRTQARFLGA